MDNEQRLVALIAHESAISRQIKAVERRATMRCESYNPENIYWKIVDELIEQQSDVIMSIKNSKSNADNMNSTEMIDLSYFDQPVGADNVAKKARLDSTVSIDNDIEEDNNSAEVGDETSNVSIDK